MPAHAPASGHPIQLTGYSWASGGLEVLWRPWPSQTPTAVAGAVGQEPEHWPLARGMALELVAARPGMPGERRCVGYRPPRGGPPVPCPEWRAMPPGGHSQCADCERREGRREIVASDGSRPPTGPHAGYLMSAHEVYLAGFAPGLFKVGVASAGRTALRVLEQGAPAALVIGRADDGMAARRLEHAISLAGARERVPVRVKLRALYPPPDAAALLRELDGHLERLTAALPDGWPPDVERLDPPRRLDNTATLALDALGAPPLDAPAPPAGRVHGQVVTASGALLLTRQAQATLWGAAAVLPPDAHDLRTWLGWRVALA